MPTIRNTKKTLAERLLLNQESVTVKPLLERLEPLPSTSINPLKQLIRTSTCYHKVGKVIFTSCPPEIHFCKTKKLLCIKEYKELLEPTLDRISLFFTKMSENKIWAENPQYDSLWKWFN